MYLLSFKIFINLFIFWHQFTRTASLALLSGRALLMPHEFPITARVMIPLMLLMKANEFFNRLILHNISHSGKFTSFINFSLTFNANAVVAANREL